MKKRFQILACLLFLFVSCGEKAGPDVTIQFTGVVTSLTAAQKQAVADIYFFIQNTGQPILDSNGDGIQDVFVVPSTCPSVTPPAGCGYPFVTGTQTLGSIPSGYQYQVTAHFRDGGGTDLYKGTATFTNINAAQTIQIDTVVGP